MQAIFIVLQEKLVTMKCVVRVRQGIIVRGIQAKKSVERTAIPKLEPIVVRHVPLVIQRHQAVRRQVVSMMDCVCTGTVKMILVLVVFRLPHVN